MPDWIDEEAARRAQGIRRALTQGQHAAVNARYPGCTLHRCDDCGEPTGADCEASAWRSADGERSLCRECGHKDNPQEYGYA